MQLQDAISLITHPNIQLKENATWVDLGCGNGLFTFALANLLPVDSTIYAIDKVNPILQSLPNKNKVHIHTQVYDFVKQGLPFQQLDGILMANSFHYVEDKMAFVQKAKHLLSKTGMFLIVEYDTDKNNQWVPYPINKKKLKALLSQAGFHSYTLLGELPSAYQAGNIYAALIQ